MTTPTSPLALIVDDERSVLDSLTVLVRGRLQWRVRTASTPTDALDALDRETPDVVLTDIAMDGREAGIEILQAVRRRHPDLPVILMSAVGSRDAAIAAVNARAFAFIEKPFRNDVIESTLREAVDAARVRAAARSDSAQRGRQAQSRRHNHPGARAQAPTMPARPLVGDSPAFLDTLALVEQAARSQATVLFEGESGTGKGAFASHLHAASPRAGQPFLSVNCGAIPESLIESQFFGHVRGAFTGADQDQPGFLRAAEGGTLFLDEVSELSLGMQVKLLRALQEREAIAVGGSVAYRVNVRFVAATNRDLRREVALGRFREDLFWRLNVLSIRVPALRDRATDISLLATHTLARLRQRDPSLTTTAFAPDAMAVLEAHHWPGNVRELENAIERAVVVAPHATITAADLPPDLRHPATPAIAGMPGLTGHDTLPTLALIEQAYVHWIVHRHQGDLAAAAVTLGIPPGAVQSLLSTDFPRGPYNVARGP